MQIRCPGRSSRRETIPLPPTHHQPPEQEQDYNEPNYQEADNRKWMVIRRACPKGSENIHERLPYRDNQQYTGHDYLQPDYVHDQITIC
jgi:hypothetical protein